MPTLLIIGGTGFFGKSIIDCFNRGLLNKFEITNILIFGRSVDDFFTNYPELYSPNIELINRDIDKVTILPKADYVIHAAASTNMYHLLSDDNIEPNLVENSILNYCNIAPLFHRESKIVYCSSGAVYGRQSDDIDKIDENSPFQEDFSTFSFEKKIYCLRKRNGENLIKGLGNQNLNVSIARCFAFYGKYLPRDQHYAYGNFIEQAEKGKTIIVKTNNLVYRSYLHADDLVENLLIIAINSNPNCPIFNLGSDECISIQDLAKKIAIEYNLKTKIPLIKKGSAIDRYIPNIDKLKAAKRLFEKKFNK